MGTLILLHGTELLTYAEIVPSWFLLNLKVSKLRETYYNKVYNVLAESIANINVFHIFSTGVKELNSATILATFSGKVRIRCIKICSSPITNATFSCRR